MEEKVISHKTAQAAYEKNFSIGTEKFYMNEHIVMESGGFYFNSRDKNFLEAPTQSLLQKWLREAHKIYIDIDVNLDETGANKGYLFCVYKTAMDKINHALNLINSEYANYKFRTYEEALEEALLESLKLI